jgi:uncharacterized protein YjlB
MHEPVDLRALPTRASDLTAAEWKPVRHELGITAFGANGYVASAPGQLMIEDHSEAETGFEELYVVVAGEVDFTIEDDDGNDETFHATAGSLVFVPAACGRVAHSRTPDAAILVVGAVPGKPFSVSAWERLRL